MKQIILGTAGHIDHGKTSLIKALTGTDTDRLKEEKQRGITIELGFAALDLPSGQHLGIIDVPGHEKFVKNMVAGATGIDIVALIIAADEGVMPQTREHMEICTLLGIQHGLVALTKVDMVDEEWMELVIDDIADFTRGTFLEDQPVIPVSSVTGQGLEDFIAALDRLSAEVPERFSSGLFRLPVDRVFTMKGFGTVITGTLISGRIRTGEEIMIYPSGITSRVRGIQVHNQSVEEASTAMRTAINFQGLDKSVVNRGDVVSTPRALRSSYMLDVSLHYLAGNRKPLKNRTRIRFHAGTSEILGNVILLESDELSPGEATVAQLRLDAPVALVRDDRFVIRSYSPVRTIGGGQILNPVPEKHKRFKPEIVEGLKGLVEQKSDEIISFHARSYGYKGVSFKDLKLMTNLPDKLLQKILGELLSRRDLVLVDRDHQVYVHREQVDALRDRILTHLQDFHLRFPLKAGMPKEELKSKFPAVMQGKLFTMMLNLMVKQNDIRQEENTVALAGHKVSLGIDQADIREKILKLYLEKALTPPYFKEVVKLFGLDNGKARSVLMLLVEEGQLIKAKEDLYFHRDAIERLKKRVVEFLKDNQELTTPQFKDMTGVSRKYLIPLLEYFDASHVTIRIGDIRRLRSG